MKNKVLLGLSALALLASCGGPSSATGLSTSQDTNPSSSLSSDASATSKEQEPSSDATAESSSTGTAESSSDSEESSVSSDTTPAIEDNWDDEDLLTMEELLNGHDIPYIGADEGYTLTADDLEIFISGTTDYAAEDLIALFTDLGYTVDYDEGEEGAYPLLDAWLYDEDYSYVYVSIEFLGENMFGLYATYAQAVATWPSDQITAYADATGVSEIPEFEAEAYVFYTNESDGVLADVIECYGEDVDADSEDTYALTLEGAGYVQDEIYALFGINYFQNETGNTIAFYFDGLSLVIQAWYEEVEQTPTYDEFPAEDIQALLEEVLGDSAPVVPTYDGDEYYLYIDEEEGEVYSFYETLDDALNTESDYYDTLSEEGWLIDESVYDEDGYYAYKDGVALNFFAWEDEDGPYFYIYFYFDDAPEIPEAKEETFDDAVPGQSSVITFADEEYLIQKGTQTSIWNNGAFSFVVNKGTATLDVGNGSYYSNPLRTYAGQEIVIRSEVAFDSVTFVATGKAEDSVPAFSAPSAGAWDGLTLNFDSPVTSVSFSVASGQARFSDVTVTFFGE
ncbi:MAG: hypothetical protein J6A47_02460 [Bacilli bacterium]|nr:hypothetical protein [Bacilli bacterium]